MATNQRPRLTSPDLARRTRNRTTPRPRLLARPYRGEERGEVVAASSDLKTINPPRRGRGEDEAPSVFQGDALPEMTPTHHFVYGEMFGVGL